MWTNLTVSEVRNSRLKKHSCSWAKDVKPCEDDDVNYDMIMISKLLNRDDSCIDKAEAVFQSKIQAHNP